MRGVTAEYNNSNGAKQYFKCPTSECRVEAGMIIKKKKKN